MHTIICEYCESNMVIGHGNYKGRKRYKCLNCKRTFNDFTGTPVSKLREKEKFNKYVRYFNSGLSIREIAKKVKISLKTSFLWRKKILSNLENIGYSQPQGDIGLASINFPASEKGNKNIKGRQPRKRGTGKNKIKEAGDIPVLIFTDNNDNFVVEVGDYSFLESIDFKNILDNWTSKNIKIAYSSDLPNHLKNKVSIIQKGKTHETIKAEELKNSLNAWMKKFTGGVSTRYLKSYLNWFRIHHLHENEKEIFLKLVISSKKTSLIIKK